MLYDHNYWSYFGHILVIFFLNESELMRKHMLLPLDRVFKMQGLRDLI